jgi:hypothetical protein
VRKLEIALVEPGPVVAVVDDGAEGNIHTLIEARRRDEFEETIHVVVTTAKGGCDVFRQQQRRMLVPVSRRGVEIEHRGRSQLLCSDKRRMIEERAEGATRCRDVSTREGVETFANRASSQVGSDAMTTTSVGSDFGEAVGAGERGRLGSDGMLLLRTGCCCCCCGTGIDMAPRILVMFCHACSSCWMRSRSSLFSLASAASTDADEDDDEETSPSRRERFSSSN